MVTNISKRRGALPAMLAGIAALAVAISAGIASTPSGAGAGIASAASGGWVLKGVEPSTQSPKEASDWCYNSFEVTIDGLSATTSRRCSGTRYDVYERVQYSWSAAPPERLAPGELLRITSTTSVEGTFHTVGLGGGGSSSVRIDLVPGGGPYPGTGWAGATEENTPVSAVSEFTIPSGSEGGLMLVSLQFSGGSAASSGKTTYTYEWQETASGATPGPTGTGQAPTETTAPRPTEEEEPWSCWGWPRRASLLESYFGASVAHALDSGARFTYFSGEVTVAPGHDLDDTRFASFDMVLEVGNHIKTESDSCAVISFADQATFVMNSFTRIILESPPEKQSKLSLLAGKILVNIKKMWKDGSMDVTTNQAVAGTKGTIFVLEETGEESTMKVLEGNVEFTSLATGETVMVGAGETVSATAEGLSEKGTFDVEAESALWPREGGDGLPALVIVAGVIALVLLVGLIFVRQRKQGT